MVLSGDVVGPLSNHGESREVLAGGRAGRRSAAEPFVMLCAFLRLGRYRAHERL